MPAHRRDPGEPRPRHPPPRHSPRPFSGSALDARQPIYVFSRPAIREVDRLASAEYGIPSMVLMENAARGLADVAAAVAEPRTSEPVLCICGRGNNGGDGLAAARHLHNAGFQVAILLAGRAAELGGDAAAQFAIVRAMGLDLTEADPSLPADAMLARIAPPGVVIDALLGTGLDRPVTGPFAALIAALNTLGRERGATVIAADLPSGLDAQTGAALATGNAEPDRAVRADITVTFAGLKKGFTALQAQPYLGEVVVRGIGVPVELLARLGQPLEPAAFPAHPDGPDSRPTPPSPSAHPGDLAPDR